VEKAIQEPAGFNPEDLLLQAHQVILPEPNGHKPTSLNLKNQAIKVGVDLGTAYTVLAVLDDHDQPLAGEYRFTQVVRDGLVVDYFGAVNTLQAMKRNIEARLGLTLNHAASGYPPGVPLGEVRATAPCCTGCRYGLSRFN
jgi:ethanolamine utilization protein EutJ